jgi:NAD-specific glutamate dehydrogenase
MVRAYSRYLLQTGLPFSPGYIGEVLVRHSVVTGLLAQLFTARFDPTLEAAARRRALARIDIDLHAALTAVLGSDEDRILRAFWNTLNATVRTNFYCVNELGQPREYLSFKIESQQLRELPLPKPLFEIFVFSPRMEGVHLRMGKVARGGIRWSARPHEGAERQEYGHRAGRRQGGLRAEAQSHRQSRGAASRSHRLLSHLDSRHARSDRQHRRRYLPGAGRRGAPRR